MLIIPSRRVYVPTPHRLMAYSMLICFSMLSVAPIQGSEQGAGYHGRAPPEAINRPATSDSVCGRYMAYSGKDSGEGVWSRPAPFGVLNDKTMEATAEGVHGATAQAAADIKRRRLMDNATSGFNLAAPSLHWSGDKKYPINAADRDGIGNMVSWQRENSEMLCQPPRPPRTHQGTRQWIAPPLSSLNIRSPSYRTFDTLDGVSGDKAPFHVPTVLPRVSTIFSNNRHGTPTLRRGNYSPPYQSPTSEALPAYMRDRHLDEVHANDVARRGQQYSERCSVSMTSGDWQQRVGHNRFVQTGGWSEDGRPVTASGRVKRWRRRSMPVAIPIDSRQGEGATSRPYPGRNGDFPKYSAWDTGFHQQNFPHHPTGVSWFTTCESSCRVAYMLQAYIVSAVFFRGLLGCMPPQIKMKICC